MELASGLGNSATLDSGLRLFGLSRLGLRNIARKQCHVRQWIKTVVRPVLRGKFRTLGNSATLDSGLRLFLRFFCAHRFRLGNSATLDSGLRLLTPNSTSVLYDLGNSATLDSGLRLKPHRPFDFLLCARKQCHVRQWIILICKYK